MGLEAAEVGTWLGNYLRVGSEESLGRIHNDMNELLVALSEVRSQGLSAEEESVFGHLEYVVLLADEHIDEVLLVHDEIETEVARFSDIRVQLDSLLDEEIQLVTAEALTASRADAHA